VRRIVDSCLDLVQCRFHIAQPVTRDQVEVIVARELARFTWAHDLMVTADRDDDRRARQLRIAHDRARGDAEILGPCGQARPPRSSSLRLDE